MLAPSSDAVFVTTSEVKGSVLKMDLATGQASRLHPFEDAIEARRPVVRRSNLYFDALGGMGLTGLIFEVPSEGEAGAKATHAIDAQSWGTFTIDEEHMYWAKGLRIMRSAHGSTEEFPLITLPQNEVPFDLGENAQFVFVLTPAGILSVPKIGAASPTVVDSTAVDVFHFHVAAIRLIVADEKFVYWVTASPPAIKQVPVAGGPTETVATAIDSITSIALDDGHVYWIADGSSIMSFDKSTKAIAKIASVTRAPSDLAVSSDSIWWVVDDVSSGSVYRVAK